MQAIINRKRYSTETATLLADDRYWDGSNHSRHGRNTYLYRTPNGAYFVHNTTQWEGERESICPLDRDIAYETYEHLPEKTVPVEVAFPDIAIENA